MDARTAVIQQLELLPVEIDALSKYLSVLDDDYVSAEPGGKASIKAIFSSFLSKDQAFLSALGFEESAVTLGSFPEILEVVKSTRSTLLERLNGIDNFEHVLESDSRELSIAEFGRETAMANAGGLKMIAYRLHESQNFFSKS